MRPNQSKLIVFSSNRNITQCWIHINNDYNQQIELMRQEFEKKIRQKEISFETRLAEINLEYEEKINELLKNAKGYKEKIASMQKEGKLFLSHTLCYIST